MGALALRFAILTAARTGEVIGARWLEIEMDSTVWTVPEGRMKRQREHRVPLSKEAIRVVKAARKLQSDDHVEVVFDALRGKAMSNAGMSAVLKRMKRMKRTDVTVHGFRSTFRDGCAEQTAFPREIAEAALAHVLTNKAEAACQRGDLPERRHTLMDAWARFDANLPRARQPAMSRRSVGREAEAPIDQRAAPPSLLHQELGTKLLWVGLARPAWSVSPS